MSIICQTPGSPVSTEPSWVLNWSLKNDPRNGQNLIVQEYADTKTVFSISENVQITEAGKIVVDYTHNHSKVSHGMQ